MLKPRSCPAAALAMLFCGLFWGCAKQVAAPTPGQSVSVEQSVYADLLTAQAALEGLKEKLATFPAIKPQLNQAIASYNVAETAFQAYEKSKDPNALAALPATITDLNQKISLVQLIFSTPVAKP
jgi:hypothetical protein